MVFNIVTGKTSSAPSAYAPSTASLKANFHFIFVILFISYPAFLEFFHATFFFFVQNCDRVYLEISYYLNDIVNSLCLKPQGPELLFEMVVFSRERERERER